MVSKRINNNIAITGEINLQGQITAIGGLESKILGGIRAGVNTFLYPKANNREFKEFMEKFSSKEIVTNMNHSRNNEICFRIIFFFLTFCKIILE